MQRREALKTVLLGAIGASAPWLGATRARAETSSGSGPAGRRRIRLGVLPIESCLQAFVARDRGFFDQEGLDIDLTFMAGGAVVAPAVAGGTLDIGYSNVVSLLIAQDRGFDFQVLTEGGIHLAEAPAQKAVVLANSPINGPRDLVGKTYAVNTLGNVDELGFRLWVRQNGVDPAQVKVVEVNFPNMPAALSNGRVDAAQVGEPFLTLVTEQLDVRIIGVPHNSIASRFAIAAYFARRSWIQANRSVAERFVRALSRATEWLNSHHDELPRIIAANTRVNEDLARRVVLQAFAPRLRLSDFEVLAEPVLREGFVRRKPDVGGLISDVALVEG